MEKLCPTCVSLCYDPTSTQPISAYVYLYVYISSPRLHLYVYICLYIDASSGFRYMYYVFIRERKLVVWPMHVIAPLQRLHDRK